MHTFQAYLQLIRPSNWLKNIFIFLPLFFSGDLVNELLLFYSFVAFISFCCIASSIYCINDLKDIETDKIHPEKCKRPLASGIIQPICVIPLIIVLVIVSFAISFLLPYGSRINLITIIAIYFGLNLLYTFYLKKIALIDVFIIAIGFVLRVFAGGVACEILLSPWIIIMTFLITLFMAFAKRRDDVINFEKYKIQTRKNTSEYNISFMNQTLGILCSVTIVAYILYTMSADVIERFQSNYIYITSIFVLAGLLRYLQISIVKEKSGNPTKILMKDRFIQISIICWILSFIIIIYG